MFEREKSDAIFMETLDLLDALNSRDGRFEYADYSALYDSITALYDSFMDVDEQVEKLTWISVTEKLPEDGRTVLTYTMGGNIEVYLYDSTTYQPSWYAVTHWMPLPKPPKKEDEKAIGGGKNEL